MIMIAVASKETTYWSGIKKAPVLQAQTTYQPA
jgi:hypothetical protein